MSSIEYKLVKLMNSICQKIDSFAYGILISFMSTKKYKKYQDFIINYFKNHEDILVASLMVKFLNGEVIEINQKYEINPYYLIIHALYCLNQSQIHRSAYFLANTKSYQATTNHLKWSSYKKQALLYVEKCLSLNFEFAYILLFQLTDNIQTKITLLKKASLQRNPEALECLADYYKSIKNNECAQLYYQSCYDILEPWIELIDDNLTSIKTNLIDLNYLCNHEETSDSIEI